MSQTSVTDGVASKPIIIEKSIKSLTTDSSQELSAAVTSNNGSAENNEPLGDNNSDSSKTVATKPLNEEDVCYFFFKFERCLVFIF
jgi:hypothetical protein